MKTFLVLHLIHLWAQHAAVPVMTPNGPLYITNGGSLNLTCVIDQDAGAVFWKINGSTFILITNTTACSFLKTNSLDTYNYSMSCDQLRRFTMVKYKVNSSDDNSDWSCLVYSLNYTNLGTSLVVKVLMYVPVGSVKLQNGSALSLIENQSAVLVCETDACRPSPAIYWMKDGLNITDYPNNVTAISVGSDLFVSIGTLTYTGQRGDNRKILTCGAYNGPDSVQTSESLTVTIYYPPSIQGLTSPYKVIENQPLNVTCVVSSNPPADQISWSPSGEGSVPSTLYFSSVSRNKSGTYNCTAQNTMIPTVGTRRNGTNTSQIQVDVLYHPSIQGLTSPYKVIENKSINVTCEANSNPPADQISWSPSGEGSVPSILYFSSASRIKSGIYSCTAQNIMTPTSGSQQTGINTSQMQVDVLYPPSIQGLTSPYKVIENQPLNVTCVANSNPPTDQISWTPNGEGSVPSTLYFSSVSRNKSGTYNCTAQNTMIPTVGTQRNGTIRSQIQVDVLYPPSIQGLTSPYKVIENQPLNVTCVANSNPPADQISWSPSGEGSVSSTLYFSSVSMNKSGTYNCTAQNTMIPTVGTRRNGKITNQIQVDVLFAPEMSVKVTPSIVEVNSEVRIECSAHGEPSSYKFYDWIHKLGNMKLRHIKGIVENQSKTAVRLPNITIADMGTYICSVDNGITGPNGDIVQSVEAQIDVAGVPVAFVRDTFFGEINMPGSIKIPFFSNPNITAVEFFRMQNNTPVANDKDTQVYHIKANVSTMFYNNNVVLQGMEAVLDFRSLKESDFGQYTLVLSNNKGNATLTVYLNASAPPSPVRQFYFYRLLEKYMEFYFVPGFNGGYQQTFTVQFKQSGSLDESWKNTNINGLSEMDDTYRLPNGTFLVPVEKLQPGSYVFRMFSVNEKNKRTYSQEVPVSIEADPNTDANIGTSIAGIAGGIGGGVAVVILITGVVIFLWRRHSHTNKAADGTQRNQINAKSVRHDAADRQDYEGLHINTEASAYLQLNDITLEENRYTNTRPPQNDSYEKLHPYTNSDIQMYSSLKIPNISKDMTSEENREAKSRPPQNDSYETLHPYTNTDIQMYSSLKIPNISKDSEKVYENTRIKTTDLTAEHQ